MHTCADQSNISKSGWSDKAVGLLRHIVHVMGTFTVTSSCPYSTCSLAFRFLPVYSSSILSSLLCSLCMNHCSITLTSDLIISSSPFSHVWSLIIYLSLIYHHSSSIFHLSSVASIVLVSIILHLLSFFSSIILNGTIVRFFFFKLLRFIMRTGYKIKMEVGVEQCRFVEEKWISRVIYILRILVERISEI